MKTKKEELIDPKLAAKIKEAREKKGLTQSQAATSAKVTETFFAMTGRGESNPSFAKLKRILNAVGLDIATKKK